VFQVLFTRAIYKHPYLTRFSTGTPSWSVHQELATCSKVERGYGQALAFKKLTCVGNTLTATLYADSECTQPLR
jgi:hypothetical protein